MKKIVSVLLIFLLLTENVSAGNLKLGCISGALIDGKTGRVLYEKNGNEKRAMASTTKIMTCIVALEKGNANEVVTISGNATTMPPVKMYLKKGQQYYLNDLLYALMLESYNDVAVAIAEHIAGSTNEFAKLMNQKAKEIGMTSTHFITPNGLDAKRHYSTATDMARLGAYAIKYKRFVKIVNAKKHLVKELKNKKTQTVYNKDAYLSMDKDAIGIKTGFTNDAGYCFVGAIKNGKRKFVSCVLGSGWPPLKNQKYMDTKTLMNYGRKKFKTDHYKIKRTFQLKIDNGRNNRLYAQVKGGGYVLKSKKEKYHYKTKFMYHLPVNKNQIIGYVSIYLEDYCLASYPVKAANDVLIYDYRYCLEELIEKYFM